ncbi:hypothetical protein PWY87_31905 [Kribbella solani]|uniref:hypothetical protein n=1 Tax=Kribbella solani TaxID=236067 RepID=UPI00299FBF05|nr:hypothetical protein [Kribbella solani]MDX2969212.1 hypothetical protein [Kribbella solani]MDX3006325.1 hypothetical protein [Kribbella solani]
MIRRIIVTALAALTVAIASTAPAAAATTYKEVDIYDPAGRGAFIGQTATDSTKVRITGEIRGQGYRVTATACISASISGCGLVANQHALGVADGRSANKYLGVDKTFGRTSGQTTYVRACFLGATGVSTCSSWTAGR